MLMRLTKNTDVYALCSMKKCNIIHRINYSSLTVILMNIYHGFMVLMFIYVSSQLGALQEHFRFFLLW